MKKIILFLFLIIIPIKTYAISASSYIVIDSRDNRILEGFNVHTKRLIASTTKIMTAIIAIENKDIKDEVTIDEDVLKAFGSNIYIEIGEKLTLEDLLYGLLLRSGNDAAIEIANYVGGSMENFVSMMNQKAYEIGMNNTSFINSSGLEDKDGKGNTSTAYDMAILMSYALNNDIFKTITSTEKYTVTTNYKTYEWTNKNKLLSTYEYTIGGKTGYTKKAKRTLVTAAKKENKELIVVTLNDPDDYKDHKNLYEKNFKKYELIKVLDKNNLKIDNNIYYDELYIENDVNLLLTKEEQKDINISYEINKISNYKNKEKVGEAIIKIGEDKIASTSVYAKKYEEIKEGFFTKIWNAIFHKK